MSSARYSARSAATTSSSDIDAWRSSPVRPAEARSTTWRPSSQWAHFTDPHDTAVMNRPADRGTSTGQRPAAPERGSRPYTSVTSVTELCSIAASSSAASALTGPSSPAATGAGVATTATVESSSRSPSVSTGAPVRIWTPRAVSASASRSTSRPVPASSPWNTGASEVAGTRRRASAANQRVAVGSGLGELRHDRCEAELVDVAGVDAADERRHEVLDDLGMEPLGQEGSDGDIALRWGTVPLELRRHRVDRIVAEHAAATQRLAVDGDPEHGLGGQEHQLAVDRELRPPDRRLGQLARRVRARGTARRRPAPRARNASAPSSRRIVVSSSRTTSEVWILPPSRSVASSTVMPTSSWALASQAAASPVMPPPMTTRRRVGGFTPEGRRALDPLRQRSHDRRIVIERPGAGEGEADFGGDAGGLDVEVVDDLEVIRREALGTHQHAVAAVDLGARRGSCRGCRDRATARGCGRRSASRSPSRPSVTGPRWRRSLRRSRAARRGTGRRSSTRSGASGR